MRRDALAQRVLSSQFGKAEYVVLLGPPGVGKIHSAIEPGYKAIAAGSAAQIDIAGQWLTELQAAHAESRIEAELREMRRYR